MFPGSVGVHDITTTTSCCSTCSRGPCGYMILLLAPQRLDWQVHVKQCCSTCSRGPGSLLLHMLTGSVRVHDITTVVCSITTSWTNFFHVIYHMLTAYIDHWVRVHVGVAPHVPGVRGGTWYYYYYLLLHMPHCCLFNYICGTTGLTFSSLSSF